MEEQDKLLGEISAQMKLARLMNDTGTIIRVAGEDMRISGIKPAVAMLIAEESVKIQKAQSGDMVDALKCLAECEPAVARCIALAILNEKDRIFKDYRKREWSDELLALEDKIMWESDRGERVAVLAAVMQMLDLSFFFQTTAMIDNFRQMMLAKRTHAQK